VAGRVAACGEFLEESGLAVISRGSQDAVPLPADLIARFRGANAEPQGRVVGEGDATNRAAEVALAEQAQRIVVARVLNVWRVPAVYLGWIGVGLAVGECGDRATMLSPWPATRRPLSNRMAGSDLKKILVVHYSQSDDVRGALEALAQHRNGPLP
jgi:hypothetical protein